MRYPTLLYYSYVDQTTRKWKGSRSQSTAGATSDNVIQDCFVSSHESVVKLGMWFPLTFWLLPWWLSWCIEMKTDVFLTNFPMATHRQDDDSGMRELGFLPSSLWWWLQLLSVRVRTLGTFWFCRMLKLFSQWESNTNQGGTEFVSKMHRFPQQLNNHTACQFCNSRRARKWAPLCIHQDSCSTVKSTSHLVQTVVKAWNL